MANFNYLKQYLSQLKQNNLLRELKIIESAQQPEVTIENRKFHLFASNNYLNLANSPELIETAHLALNKYGYGAAASRLISGTMAPHIKVEQQLAEFTKKQAGLLFPSGWMANEAVIRTIPHKGDLILLDKLNHASIIDAARASHASFRTYRRQNLNRLKKLLEDKNYNRKFIVTESVFSMDGDCADLVKLVELKKKYNAYLIVDEAHAFGCLGKTGAGLAEQLGVLEDIDIFIATLSKAFAATGGIVTSSETVRDYLINKARAFIYTTAPSPVNASVISKALDIIKNASDKRNRLTHNSDYLRNSIKAHNLNTGNSATHILPLIIGPEEKTLELASKLFKNGFYVPAIRPPTVPPNSSRLRISLQSDHTKQQLDGLLKELEKFLC